MSSWGGPCQVCPGAPAKARPTREVRIQAYPEARHLISSNLRAVLASAVVYAIATAVMGRHLLASIGSAIAADVGDPVLNAAILAWNARIVPWTDAWFNFPAFYPATDTLTFSEHLLGVSVLATPLNWLTGNAVAAYNLTLLAGYVLCGLAMFALVKRITGSAAAAFLAGAAYAFAPYRAPQLSHIQVGIAFWAPLALLGLHQYLETGRRRWLTLFGLCWMLQGAANLYYLVYFSVLVGLWVLWFVVAPRRWRDLWPIAATLAVAALPLLPIVARYRAAHEHYGLSRPYTEIIGFSADIAAVFCASSHLDVWGSLQIACRPEGELFPGITIVLLCVAGALAWYRRPRAVAVPAARRTVTGGTVLAAAVLLIVSVAGPWEWPSVSFRVSSSSMTKPLFQGLGALVLAALCWIAQRRVMRQPSEGRASRAVTSLRILGFVLVVAAGLFVAAAVSVAVAGPWEWAPEWAQLSSVVSSAALVLALLAVALLLNATPGIAGRPAVAGFYIFAALATWVLALGPAPVLAGESALPQGPYAWLMLLPGVDGLRVPARFWMMTTLCLSVLAGFAGAALLERRSRVPATAILAVVAGGFLLDGWATIPTGQLLPPPPDPGALRGGVALTLPLGDNRDIDIAAQFAAVTGGYVSVNGFSGYESSHYDRLRQASRRADSIIFAPYRARGDLQVIVAERASSLVRLVEEQPGTRHVGTAGGWRQYRMTQRGRLPRAEPTGTRLKIATVTASCSDEMLPLVSDGDQSTRWHCGPQRPGQQLTIDLGTTTSIGAVVPALGRFPTDYPRHLRIETSVDGREWAPAWDDGVIAAVIEAEFHNPAENRLVLTFASRPARYLRLQLMTADDVWYWSISELEVWSGSS